MASPITSHKEDYTNLEIPSTVEENTTDVKIKAIAITLFFTLLLWGSNQFSPSKNESPSNRTFRQLRGDIAPRALDAFCEKTARAICSMDETYCPFKARALHARASNSENGPLCFIEVEDATDISKKWMGTQSSCTTDMTEDEKEALGTFSHLDMEEHPLIKTTQGTPLTAVCFDTLVTARPLEEEAAEQRFYESLCSRGLKEFLLPNGATPFKRKSIAARVQHIGEELVCSIRVLNPCSYKNIQALLPRTVSTDISKEDREQIEKLNIDVWAKPLEQKGADKLFFEMKIKLQKPHHLRNRI